METADGSVDVLVVGAGPTGLTLASRLAALGVSVRLVDLKAGPVAESRALGVQPRTLEVLRGPVTDELLERGNPAVELRWHAGDRVTALPLFDMGMDDTAYPFLLYLSQSEIEAVLVDHLRRQGVDVNWQTRFVGQVGGPPADALACELLDAEGNRHTVVAQYVIGCDGARSTVRELAGIPFTGDRYPQTFLLADLDAEGLDPDAAHAWLSGDGPVLFFPLARPAAWRLLAARPHRDRHAPAGDGDAATEAAPVTLGELQGVVDAATGGSVRLGTPLWATAFRIHHRHAATYRAGRMFLAGDAAHIHSPAGGQGMNTGVQDAVNLGWKLALVCTGRSPERLLDTYDAERRPVGEFVLRFTDRAFTAATSGAPVLRFVRSHVAPRALALIARPPGVRGVAFRTVSELGIRYPDRLDAPGTVAGRRTARPAPGERLPDLRVLEAGHATWLHDHLAGPGFHLLLCGAADRDEAALEDLTTRYAGLLAVVRLARPRSDPADGILVAADGAGWRRLGITGEGHLLVRPDGHVACRQEGTDLAGVCEFLGRWLGG